MQIHFDLILKDDSDDVEEEEEPKLCIERVLLNSIDLASILRMIFFPTNF